MNKNTFHAWLLALGTMLVFAACSGNEELPTPTDTLPEATETPADGTRDITVNLIPETNRTAVTTDAQLQWRPGDKIAYYTSADGVTWTTSKEADIDATQGSFVATGIPASHKKIRVTYPSQGEGKAYVRPQVEKRQTVGTGLFQQIEAEGNRRCLMQGQYLPMEAEPADIPANNVVNAVYKVLGAVIKFNIPVPTDNSHYYTIKAIKAGDYLYDCQINTPAIDSNVPLTMQGMPVYDGFYQDYPFCIVVPVGNGVEYTPTVYAQVWDSGMSGYTQKQYKRNAAKTSDFTAKAYDINLNFTDASRYDVSDNWNGLTSEEEATITPYRHGYSRLSEKEQQVYDYIVEKLLHFENNADTYGDIYHRAYMNFDEVGYYMGGYENIYKFLEIIKSDRPEIYYLINTIPRTGDTSNTYYARIGKSFTPEACAQGMAEIDAAVKTLTEGVTPAMSDFEKAKTIHDSFCNYVNYGDMNGAHGGTAYGGLVNKRAVCEGLSRSFLLLCQRVGLKCIYVSGSLQTNSVEDKWGNHAWNYVEVDGKWYMMDITEDCGFSGYVNYNGFLIGQENANKGHRLATAENGQPTGGDPNAFHYGTLPALNNEDYPWR